MNSPIWPGAAADALAPDTTSASAPTTISAPQQRGVASARRQTSQTLDYQRTTDAPDPRATIARTSPNPDASPDVPQSPARRTTLRAVPRRVKPPHGGSRQHAAPPPPTLAVKTATVPTAAPSTPSAAHNQKRERLADNHRPRGQRPPSRSAGLPSASASPAPCANRGTSGGFISRLQRATRIDVGARVTPLHPPGNSEVSRRHPRGHEGRAGHRRRREPRFRHKRHRLHQGADQQTGRLRLPRIPGPGASGGIGRVARGKRE